jgi:hypothetical protein
MCTENCNGCKISIRKKRPTGGIVKLEGDWILCHYTGGDSFLGRLALQTECHRMDLAELEPKEASALGINIKKIDKALRDYWSEEFTDDPIERTYIVYFFESVLDRDVKEEWHLHIHLIPRTKKLGMDGQGKYRPWDVAAWNTYKLPYRFRFPDEYRIKDKKGRKINEERIKALMRYLRGNI